MKKGNRIVMLFAAANVLLIIVCAVLYLRTDRKPPDFSFSQTETVYREGIDKAKLLEGITAFDSKDGSITEKIVIEKIVENREENHAVVFYAVSDEAGNSAKCSRQFPAVFIKEQTPGNPAEQFMQAGVDARLKPENIMMEESLPADGAEASAEPEGEAEAEAPAEPKGEAEAEPTATPAPYISPSPKANASSSPISSDTPGGLEPAPRPTARTPERQQEQMPNPEKKEASEGGAEEEAAEPDRSQPPVLTLKTREVTVKAGVRPAWVELIGILSDDKDGYETLFHNLKISKYDVNKPGSYPVTVCTEDSNGNRSAEVPITIIVQ